MSMWDWVTNCPQSRLYRSHTQDDSFLCSNRTHSLLWTRIKIHIEQLVHILWSKFRFFLLLNHTFDTFKTTEENQCVLESFEALEFFEIDNFAFVTGSESAVIALFIRTLVENGLQGISYADIIAPVDTCFKERFLLAHYLACIELYLVREVFLIKFHCNSSTFLETNINLTIFIDSNVYPGALSFFTWTINHTTFAIWCPFICT